jgi:hypothetical protein
LFLLGAPGDAVEVGKLFEQLPRLFDGHRINDIRLEIAESVTVDSVLAHPCEYADPEVK